MNSLKIKAQEYKKGTLINNPQKAENFEDKKVSFSFEDFKGDSILIDDYNSYYFNLESSRNAVADFITALKNISSLTIKEFFEPATKKRFHLNQIEDDDIVSRIEHVLINGYSFPEKKVEQFEKTYIEFQISDGKRVFAHKVDEILYPLFIDCNHLICKDSSRNFKAKQSYNVKSSFVKQSEEDLNIQDLDMIDNIKMILNAIENEDLDIETVEEFLKELVK